MATFLSFFTSDVYMAVRSLLSGDHCNSFPPCIAWWTLFLPRTCQCVSSVAPYHKDIINYDSSKALARSTFLQLFFHSCSSFSWHVLRTLWWSLYFISSLQLVFSVYHGLVVSVSFPCSSATKRHLKLRILYSIGVIYILAHTHS